MAAVQDMQNYYNTKKLASHIPNSRHTIIK